MILARDPQLTVSGKNLWWGACLCSGTQFECDNMIGIYLHACTPFKAIISCLSWFCLNALSILAPTIVSQIS